MILWHLLPGAAPISLPFLFPSGGVADLLRYDGLLCSGRPADLLRNTGRFTPEQAGIPKTLNKNLSVHYTIDDNKVIRILHKGKFTVGHGSVSMAEFFNYYRNNPGRWQLISFLDYDYLELAQLNTNLTDTDFVGLLDSLSEFTKYIRNFKNLHR